MISPKSLWTLVAPKLSKKQEAKERASLTQEELEASRMDVYGDTYVNPDGEEKVAASNNVETASISSGDTKTSTMSWGKRKPLTESEMQDLLDRMEYELTTNIPNEEKGSYLQAVEQCPNEVNVVRKKRFIHRADLDPAEAAARLVYYWKERLAIFGPEKCYMPMTINGALCDDWEALSCGGCMILPGTDSSGRRFFFVDPTKIKFDTYTQEQLLRAWWYYLEALLDTDESVAEKGAVEIVFTYHAKGPDFRPVFRKTILLQQSIIPIRFAAVHSFIRPGLVYSIFGPLFKLLLDKRMRSRMVEHTGSMLGMAMELQKYGIGKEVIPEEMGGELNFDVTAWLEVQKKNGH
eukprot:CAMPEP_0118706328 /NCGR_PEP_ID=MMETSP0800-20121206/20490_1 /TAXON_ID=210618 ORGANISM="Striatella unipunctata, Strain CCMP2910" /NCGR_SAMPLE_ID=MMETSP0800 /ASSEMBLY_ACC=CAM_ASM_000638 /LENGTH=349 /DNA_ID=CAMNT_0006608837 /DNA_START=74 /DNA_END=1123 /DNA_ORIENTATION=+